MPFLTRSKLSKLPGNMVFHEYCMFHCEPRLLSGEMYAKIGRELSTYYTKLQM